MILLSLFRQFAEHFWRQPRAPGDGDDGAEALPQEEQQRQHRARHRLQGPNSIEKVWLEFWPENGSRFLFICSVTCLNYSVGQVQVVMDLGWVDINFGNSTD